MKRCRELLWGVADALLDWPDVSLVLLTQLALMVLLLVARPTVMAVAPWVGGAMILYAIWRMFFAPCDLMGRWYRRELRRAKRARRQGEP